MACENDSMDAEEAVRAEKLSQKISSIIYSTRCWEHHPGNPELLKKLLRAVDEVTVLFWQLGLIEDYRYSELSRQSRYLVDTVLETVFGDLLRQTKKKLNKGKG